jgi:hypothetical protein
MTRISDIIRFGGIPAVADNALEAMGPVLESVLGSLTQEYEKRLLAKDHEVKAAQQQLAALRHELAEAREYAAENARLLPAPEVQPGASHVRPYPLTDGRYRSVILLLPIVGMGPLFVLVANLSKICTDRRRGSCMPFHEYMQQCGEGVLRWGTFH